MKRLFALGMLLVLVVGMLAGCAQEAAKPVGDPDKKAMLVVSFGTSYHDTRERLLM